MAFTVGEGGVDIGGDAQHIACNIFFRVIVTGEVAGYVAIVALNTQRGAERIHRLPQIGVGREHTEVGWRGGWKRNLAASAPAALGEQSH